MTMTCASTFIVQLQKYPVALYFSTIGVMSLAFPIWIALRWLILQDDCLIIIVVSFLVLTQIQNFCMNQTTNERFGQGNKKKVVNKSAQQNKSVSLEVEGNVHETLMKGQQKRRSKIHCNCFLNCKAMCYDNSTDQRYTVHDYVQMTKNESSPAPTPTIV